MSGTQAEKAFRGAGGNYSLRSNILRRKREQWSSERGEDSGKRAFPKSTVACWVH